MPTREAMSYEEERDNAKLCYISGDWAYFTTQDVTEQWGDDWNDAPYEHNAGRPYDFREYNREEGKEPWSIFEVALSTNLSTPCEGTVNSQYSVQYINRKAVPWLQSNPWSEPGICIWAGTTFKEFATIINQAGGTVYVPYAVG